jgi:hypothetical protein
VTLRRLAALAAAASILLAVLPAGVTAAATPQVRPIGEIKGVAYQPVPSDYSPCQSCVYYDTDFFNADFPLLWSAGNGGRGDLKTIGETVKANLLHLYDWNPARNHLPFLNEAASFGVRVAVPISNYFAGDPDGLRANIEQIVRQVYVDSAGGASKTPHPAAAMWLIANEYDYVNNHVTAAQVARVAEIIYQTEQSIGATTVLPMSSPVSFGVNGDPQGRPAIVAITNLMTALDRSSILPGDFVRTRFLAAANPQNRGTFIATWLDQYAKAWPAPAYTPPLWFAELGTGVLLSCAGYRSGCVPSEQQQATFNAEQWQYSVPGQPGAFFLGSAQFEWIDEPWKGDPATTNDATFGVLKYAGTYTTHPTAGGTYRVDELVQKPSWSVLLGVPDPALPMRAMRPLRVPRCLLHNDPIYCP